MLQPQELRIGNWVYQKDHGECLVLGMPRKGEKLELGYFKNSVGFERRIGTIYPIPLNEQWLEDFGFEKLSSNNIWRSNFGKDGWHLVLWHPHNNPFKLLIDNQLGIDISSVHHLQNLFWCLTGQELELKKQRP